MGDQGAEHRRVKRAIMQDAELAARLYPRSDLIVPLDERMPLW